MEEKEIWRTVIYDGEVFEGYEVSNMGRVRSLNYGGRTGVVKELKPSVNSGGYLLVALYKGRKQKMCYVHRIVAYTFLSNNDIENKTEVNHIDENKTNNKVENLEWCNREQNINHGTRTEQTSKKVKCVETGIVYESAYEVERKLGLAHNNICCCCNGKNYKTVGGYHWKYVD